jgi:6-phosphogluconolactonase
LDAAASKLTPNEPPFAVVAHGAGPRHLAFHPNGKFVYVINEMALTITLFNYDAAKGVLFEEQTVSTLPDGYTATGKDSAAEIAVHPSGRFVYGSNRGHNTIAVFAVDEKSGRLKLVQNWPSHHQTPRHFAIDPSGRWLLAENQDSNNVVLFAIDQQTGELKHTGRVLDIPSPVCAVFVNVK